MRCERFDGSARAQWERVVVYRRWMAVVVVLTLVCLGRVGLGAHLTQLGRRTQALEKRHAELAERNARLTTELIRKSSTASVRERLSAAGITVVAGRSDRMRLRLPVARGTACSTQDLASRVSQAVADAGRATWPEAPRPVSPRAVAWARGR